MGMQGADLGPGGKMLYHLNERGENLASYFYPAASPTAVIVMCHGHGSCMTYDFLKASNPGLPTCYEGSWIQALNTAGFSVCGMDNQGKPKSVDIHQQLLA
ncbi:MAG: hypothetical protein WDW38_004266 [Sanguina aurantia]